uniref:Transmembrane p24 trafficking protein 7 n=1 Tax=Gouania willdenowi TaxID=441366 RepID=A0A8C5ECE2_GOUWI
RATFCEVLDTVLTFELPDNARQCFYKDIIIGTKSTLMFKVVMGGHFDVDCRLEDPEGTTLYKKMKKQYDSFTFNATKNRTYKFCFSNKFSTFTHKTKRVTAYTQMESACVSIFKALKSIIHYQTHFRAKDLNTGVQVHRRTLHQLVVIINQVVLLRSFFPDRPPPSVLDPNIMV